MNLIEKLGIEKCRGIVDGAPIEATHIDFRGRYWDLKDTGLLFENGKWIKDKSGHACIWYPLSSLKDEIEKYDSEHAEMIDYSQAVRVVEK